MPRLEHVYRWPHISPWWVNRMDDRYANAFNRLIFAITDVKKDIARLDAEMGIV